MKCCSRCVLPPISRTSPSGFRRQQLELCLADVTDRRMPAAHFVEPFDVIEQISSALIARAILNPIRALGFQAWSCPHQTGQLAAC